MTQRKKRLSPTARLLQVVAEAEANIASARAELPSADPKRRRRLLRKIDLATERLTDAKAALSTGPRGLGSSGERGVGLINGRPTRVVGDSTASHRNHRGFRK